MAYRDRFWNASVMHKRVSANFDPGMGFVRRRGFQQHFATLGVHARPRLRLIQEVNPYVEADYYADFGGAPQSHQVTAGLDVFFKPDGELKLEVSDWFDRLDQIFTPYPGRSIPVGRYAYRNAQATYTSTQRYPVYGSANLRFGEYYDGTNQAEAAASGGVRATTSASKGHINTMTCRSRAATSPPTWPGSA